MMKRCNFIPIFFVFFVFIGFGQEKLTGVVKDAATNEPLLGVNIIELDNSRNGAVSDFDGNFTITVESLPTTVSFSFVGYTSQTVTISNTDPLSILLAKGPNQLDEIIVYSASREAQKIVDAPATITQISSRQISEIATPDPFVLLSTAKGVEYNRKGVGVVDFNIRGFNTSFNPRNLMIVDGRLSNLVSLGLPYLQLTSFIKEDIDNVEVVLGPSSALYGFGASNGLVNITTKDPRKHEGTSISIGGGNLAQKAARLRFAKKISDKVGIKLTGGYQAGNNFMYTDSSFYTISAANLPQLSASGTGVAETGLDDDFDFFKVEAGIYAEVANKTDVIVKYGYTEGEFIQTTSIGRNQFKGWANSYIQGKLVSPRWYLSAFYNSNKTTNPDSRVLSVLTDNVQSYTQFRDVLGAHNLSDEEIIERAQDTRLLTVLGDGTLVELPVNGKYEDASTRFNTELQYNNRWGKLRFIGGVQYNNDRGNSNTTYLIQENNEDIIYNTFGGYAQLEYKFTDGLKLVSALRADDHSQWGSFLSPKLALVSSGENGTWRITYGRGIVAPTILQGELSFAGGRLLGNSEGFTFLDVNLTSGNFETTTTALDPLTAEKLDAIEIGYKGNLGENLFLDANVFYNFHTDFITNAVVDLASPGTGRFVIERGGLPVSQFQQPIFSAGVALSGTPLEPLLGTVIPTDASASTQSYFNFGKLQTYGFDIGLNYVFTENLSGILNYSFFTNSYDEDDLTNDINNDGLIQEGVDIQINSPEHKLNAGLNYNKGKFLAGLNSRWVSKYNYFAGNTIASETLPNVVYQGTPVVENAPVAGTFNEGPLGGFVNVDLNLGYKFNKTFSIFGSVTNLFDAEVRDFVTSPTIGTLVNFELRAEF